MKLFKYFGLLAITAAQVDNLDEYADYYMDGPAANDTEIADMERGKKKQAKLAEAALLQQLGLSRTEPPTTTLATTSSFEGTRAVSFRQGQKKFRPAKKDKKNKNKYNYEPTTTTTTTSTTTSMTTTTTTSTR